MNNLLVLSFVLGYLLGHCQLVVSYFIRDDKRVQRTVWSLLLLVSAFVVGIIIAGACDNG
jgi:hypothetical protein